MNHFHQTVPHCYFLSVSEKLIGFGWRMNAKAHELSDPCLHRLENLDVFLVDREGNLQLSLYSIDPQNMVEMGVSCHDKFWSGSDVFYKP